MYSRWYTPAVVLLWLSTMTWLVWQKVLPPLLVGEPPQQQEILAARDRERLVGWDIAFNGRPLGWAASRTVKAADGGTELRATAHFDHLPVAEITPGWIQTLFKLAEHEASRIQLDARSTLWLNREGRPTRFRSAVDLRPLGDTIELEGQIQGTRLNVLARSGEFSYTTQTYLPSGVLMGDSLSPQTQLPGLHVGQTWTAPVYSPLRPPNSPLEIYRATVERMVVFAWGGATYDAWLVSYRSESGLSLLGGSPPQGRVWVRRDGTVLQQQVNLMECELTFTRMPYDRARRVLHHLKESVPTNDSSQPTPLPVETP
jgi:hypothetical protein